MYGACFFVGHGSTGSPIKPQTPMIAPRYLKASAQRLEEARGKFPALVAFVAFDGFRGL